MEYIHIIALIIVVIFCITAIGIIIVANKKGRLRTESDFIHDFYEKKEKDLKKLSFGITLNMYLAGVVIFPLITGAFVIIMTQSPIFAVICAICSMFIPEIILRILSTVNDTKFDERYLRALQQLSSSLKAGMSILESVHDVAECRFIHDSIRVRFATMALDMEMGVPVSDAFHRFADLTNSPDAKDVAIAIDVQNEVGGHESEVIEEITGNIQRRIMLRKEVKSTFAGTTSMVWIMDFVPALTLIFYLLVDKSAIEFYTGTTLGIAILVGIICSFIIGSIINHRSLNKTIKGE